MDRMIDRAAAVGMGALAIRILAAGALAGAPDRHPLAGGTGGVLITGADYESDVQRADRLRPLSDELGISLPELAIRFALAKRELATVLVGVSAIEQVEFAARAAAAGPLPSGAVERIVRQATSGGQEAALSDHQASLRFEPSRQLT
jgi:L-galactose dehydrogenase/L-glyceraldehyde 3-phosphate reductase